MKKKHKDKHNIIEKVWYILSSSERKSVAILIVFMLIGTVLETLGVGLIVPVVMLLSQDDLVNNYPRLIPYIEWLGNPTQRELVIISMFGLVGVYFVKNCFLGFLAWRQTSFTHMAGARLSSSLYTVYMCQPYSFHLRRNSAQLLRNVFSEVGIFMNAMSSFMLMTAEIMVIMSLCTMLILIDPLSASSVVIIVSSAAWIFHRLTRNQIKKWAQTRKKHEGLRVQHLQQGLGGVKDVKLLGCESYFLTQYEIHNRISAHVRQRMQALKQMPRLWIEILAVSGLAGLVLSILAQGREIENVLPILGLFAAAAFRLMPSVNRILGAVQNVRYISPIVDELYTELHLPVETDGSGDRDFKNLQNTIEINQVYFSYEDSEQSSLTNLSFKIKRGESIGIIGKSGAGKSTLVDIILGLLTPQSGEILVDGVNIQQNLRNWRNQIGYVPQSIYMTDDSLRHNIAFGVATDEIDDSSVWHALEIAQLDEFVRTLPNGLNTQVGERGVRLSGGQVQRIGIARALYHNPSVLVLDEATSSLDQKTERGVMEAVNSLHGTKTILIVAHRLSTVEQCDRLYRLDRGEFIEEGNAKEVLYGSNIKSL